MIERTKTWVFLRWEANSILAGLRKQISTLTELLNEDRRYQQESKSFALYMYHIVGITICRPQQRQHSWILRGLWCWICMIYYSVKISKEGNKTSSSTLIYTLSFCNSMSKSGGYFWKLVMDFTQRHIIVFLFKVSVSFTSYDFIFSSLLSFNFYLWIYFTHSDHSDRW